MRREIVKDFNFLTKRSNPFVIGQDDGIIQDMIDTANAHRDNCLGLAAVQVGFLKRVIVVRIDDSFIPFINPVIVKRSPSAYYATENCLSLEGSRHVKRHISIMLSYTTLNGKKRTKTFEGRTAQIIQHEVDHLNGLLI